MILRPEGDIWKVVKVLHRRSLAGKTGERTDESPDELPTGIREDSDPGGRNPPDEVLPYEVIRMVKSYSTTPVPRGSR
jgi:hypothetical protein